MQSYKSYYMVSPQTVFTYPLRRAKLQILLHGVTANSLYLSFSPCKATNLNFVYLTSWNVDFVWAENVSLDGIHVHVQHLGVGLHKQTMKWTLRPYQTLWLWLRLWLDHSFFLYFSIAAAANRHSRSQKHLIRTWPNTNPKTFIIQWPF